MEDIQEARAIGKSTSRLAIGDSLSNESSQVRRFRVGRPLHIPLSRSRERAWGEGD